MPLSSLGNINALGSAMMGAAGGPTPLDAIEARRAKRQAEAIAKQEADAKLMKSIEDRKAGQSKREGEAQLQAVLAKMPKITAAPRDPEFAQQVKDSSRYLMNSGVPEAQELAVKFLGEIDRLQKSAGIDTGTAAGQETSSAIAGRAATAKKDTAIAGAYNLHTQQQQVTPPNTVPKITPEVLSALDEAFNEHAPEQNDWNPFTSGNREIMIERAKSIMDNARARGIRVPDAEEAMIQALNGGAPQPAPIGPTGLGGGNPDDPLGILGQ